MKRGRVRRQSRYAWWIVVVASLVIFGGCTNKGNQEPAAPVAAVAQAQQKDAPKDEKEQEIQLLLTKMGEDMDRQIAAAPDEATKQVLIRQKKESVNEKMIRMYPDDSRKMVLSQMKMSEEAGKMKADMTASFMQQANQAQQAMAMQAKFAEDYAAGRYAAFSGAMPTAVQVDVANIRKEPSVDSEIVGTAKLGDQILAKGIQFKGPDGTWTRVETKTVPDGWVRGDLVGMAPRRAR